MKESQFQLPPYSQEVTTARSATYLIWPPFFFIFYAGVVTLLGDCKLLHYGTTKVLTKKTLKVQKKVIKVELFSFILKAPCNT